MKTLLLIFALFVTIASSIPNNYQHYKENLQFNRPINSEIYMINSTQRVIFDISNHCYFDNGKDLKVTFEVYSIAKQAIVDTIVEKENIWKIFNQLEFLIDKVWANNGAKYYIIATIYKEYNHNLAVSKSGTFTTVDKKYS